MVRGWPDARWHSIYEEHEFIVHRVEGWHLREQDGLGRERRNRREIQRHVPVSCEKFNHQDSIARCSHTKKSTYEGMPGTEEDRPAYAVTAHSRPSAHESACKAYSSATSMISRETKPATHAPSSHPRKGLKHQRCSNAMLARDHRIHHKSQSTSTNATRGPHFARASPQTPARPSCTARTSRM